MNRAEIRQHIIAAGLEAYLPQFEEVIVPTIDLFDSGLRGDDIPIGGSKRDGKPDLPPEFIWPDDASGMPMEFVLQINLKEAAALDSEGLLPKTGLLSFFLSCDGEGDSVLGESGIYFFPELFALARRDIARSEPGTGLRFGRSWGTPQWGTYPEGKLGFLENRDWPHALAELQWGGTQLLGQPNDYQGELEPMCEAIFTGRPSRVHTPEERQQAYRDWVCLFKESEFSGGVFSHNWMIRREHLRVADFSPVIRIDVN